MESAIFHHLQHPFPTFPPLFPPFLFYWAFGQHERPPTSRRCWRSDRRYYFFQELGGNDGMD